MTLYFEDFEPGHVFELGEVEVDEGEIVDFATKFDPQPFHVNADAAAESVFGGLIASGWHTCALFMRLYADAVLLDAASEGSPGVEAIRWLAPVRPGDRLTGTARVLEATPSARHPNRGTVLMQSEMTNQDDVVVLVLTARGLFTRRRD